MMSVYSVSGFIRSMNSEGVHFAGSFFYSSKQPADGTQNNIAGKLINHQTGQTTIEGFFRPGETVRFEEVDRHGNKASAELFSVPGTNEMRGKYNSPGLGIREMVCYISDGVPVEMNGSRMLYPEPSTREVAAGWELE